MFLAFFRPTHLLRTPRICDLCYEGLKETIVEAKTTGGFRAVMCLYCARTRAVRIGLGNGALYQREDDGRYRRVQG